jgi:hypothetical protein
VAAAKTKKDKNLVLVADTQQNFEQSISLDIYDN